MNAMLNDSLELTLVKWSDFNGNSGVQARWREENSSMANLVAVPAVPRELSDAKELSDEE